MEITCNKASPPLGGLMVAEQVKKANKLNLKINWGEKTSVGDVLCRTSNDLARVISKKFSPTLYGATPLEMTTVDQWLTFSLGPVTSKDSLNFLDKSVGSSTHLLKEKLTIADFIVFSALYASSEWQGILSSGDGVPGNVLRWYNYMSSLEAVKNTLQLPKVKEALASTEKKEKVVSDEALKKSLKFGVRAREGKFVNLPGAEMGKVVVRFPPEASGYLHIGHAKAALLNQYYKELFQGKLIMRFDDTNPAKENVHFEKVILEDIDMLDIKPDMFTYTSQYFDLMLHYCEKLITEGKAYVDDTEPERMKMEREQKTESQSRSNSVEKNLQLWKEMKHGSEIGQGCCVRAKIDMKSLNGCMRDPTIYRCKNEPHPRTGNKYKVYPTYDFACPIVDSVEGVTHTLRTMEYHDRDPQFYWFLDAMELRKPHIWEYSRLSMTNTVLSKRKLTWFVEQGFVDGWDDPRMPTVRGVLRRGMTVQGLKEFIIAQGSSRGVVFMEWDKIWAFNKKVIDPIAPRYTALEKSSTVKVLVEGVRQECLTVPKHPKNEDVGNKQVWVGPNILISREDAESLKRDHNATFINWGNVLIDTIQRDAEGGITSIIARPNLENKDYKDTLKLTWLAQIEEEPFTPTWCVYFDHIISKSLLGKDEDFKKYVGHQTRREVEMIGDPELKKLKKGDIIQLQRLGYFIVDVPYEPLNLSTCKEQHLVLFSIPDGRANKNPLNLPPAKLVRDKQVVNDYEEEEKLLQEKEKADKPPTESELNCKILDQGDVVRLLKADKAAKEKIDGEVKVLLSLKAEFKKLFNKDWKPACRNEIANKTIEKIINVDPDALDKEIMEQGRKIEQFKVMGMEKKAIDKETKHLKELLSRYKRYLGKNWMPKSKRPAGQNEPGPVSITHVGEQENEILKGIQEQGEKITSLTAPVKDVREAVDKSGQLKADYKALTGKKWKPGTEPVPVASVTEVHGTGIEKKDVLAAKITEQGNVVRELKEKKANKGNIDKAVKVLLDLKEEYKNLTGTEFPTAPRSSKKSKSKTAPPPKEEAPKVKQVLTVESSGLKKVSRLGLEATKEENLSAWYTQVITKSEMIEYYDVSGCYILRPWSFAIWEQIKDRMDKEIKEIGFTNCYFPMFVSKRALETEKTHITDFAPEVAWVTHSGDTEMAEPIAVRPTSETVMYPAYAKWIQSYRDLPLKLNQWNNVVRWEFKHPQPFLRTREFLWQEGHSAYATREEAVAEVDTTLELYSEIYGDLLAVPVVQGRKTEKEKFAGAEYTLTVEIFITASGRAIQGATSHHLGQNFSKMFEIVFEDPETQEKKFVFQNSFGITTRTIGVMIMVHSDNKGLVLPPKVAAYQAVVIPCGITASLMPGEQQKVIEYARAFSEKANKAGHRTTADLRMNYSPGWKFNHWEVKGVPLRVEVGPKDMQSNKVVFVRRDTGEKKSFDYEEAVEEMEDMLWQIQNDLYHKAKDDIEKHTVRVKEWSKFTPSLDGKNMILAPFCGTIECEDKIRAESAKESAESVEPGAPSMGAKSLCIPKANEFPEDVIQPGDKCIHPECKRKPEYYTLFGRSY